MKLIQLGFCAIPHGLPVKVVETVCIASRELLVENTTLPNDTSWRVAVFNENVVRNFLKEYISRVFV